MPRGQGHHLGQHGTRHQQRQAALAAALYPAPHRLLLVVPPPMLHCLSLAIAARRLADTLHLVAVLAHGHRHPPRRLCGGLHQPRLLHPVQGGDHRLLLPVLVRGFRRLPAQARRQRLQL